MIDLNKIKTIEKASQDYMDYGNRIDSIAEAVKYIEKPYNWIQFGVAKGNSARLLLKYLPKDGKLYLLDSFNGLPYDWENNPNQKAGAFKLNKKDIPKFDDKRVVVIPGLFKDTVNTLNQLSDEYTFIHVDCDLYQSTVDALFGIADKINKCIILFDEFYNYDGYENHEYKAFCEFIDKFKFNYKHLFKTVGHQVCFEVWR